MQGRNSILYDGHRTSITPDKIGWAVEKKNHIIYVLFLKLAMLFRPWMFFFGIVPFVRNVINFNVQYSCNNNQQQQGELYCL